MDEQKPVDIEILKGFSPLDGLKRENLHALARKTRIQELDSGRVLFKEGESDKRTVYLVGGEVELRVGDRTVSLLRAGTPEARIAIAPGQPRRPSTRSGIDGLLLAGDWIDTGLPATIEGAVVSGHRAADRVLRFLRAR